MAIYQICKPLITSTLLLTATLLTISCAPTAKTLGTAANAEAAANAPAIASSQSASGSASDSSPQETKGVRTTHDVFHSKTIEVPAGTPVPAVTVRVEQDKVDGWNLYAGTANFTFEPNKVNGESSATAGHGYLYINDKPIQRIYSTWTHLPTLPGGENVVRVTLNANGHETLTTQGEPIQDSTTLTVYDPNATD
ncbi:MAG: hypothetical protein AAFN12_10670 [Cyanobacteria bacterium J06560_2]